MKKSRPNSRRLLAIELLFEVFFSRRKSSYSTFGEDLILDGILKRYSFIAGNKLPFSYLDIGAWKPKTGSNTYNLYKKGHRGTVVEVNHRMQIFWKIIRPQDNFINVACSNELINNLFLFSSNAESNTIDSRFASKISFTQNAAIKEVRYVKGLSLRQLVLLHKKVFRGDFILDLDIEGKDFEVLHKYNFQKNPRPMIILVEDVADSKQRTFIQSNIQQYLSESGYSLAGRSAITSIYLDLSHRVSTVLQY